MTERQTWERQDDETAAQWQGFRIYRDLGPARNLQDAWKQYATERGLQTENVSSSFKDWSRFNNWVARAAAFDGAQDEIRQSIRLRARDEARHLAAERAADIVRNLVRIANGKRLEADDEDDRVSEQYIIQAAKLLLDIADVKSPTRLEVGGKALVIQGRVDEIDPDGEEAEQLIDTYLQMLGAK